MPFPSLLAGMKLKRVEKHRLFIAFPVFLAAVGMSVMSGLRAELVVPEKPENGEILMVKNRPETLVLGNDTVARAMPGAIFVDDAALPIFSEGEAVVGSPDAFSVSVKGLTLTGWNGAVRIVRKEDTLTIAALTSPVLLQGSGGSVLIPVRRQWTAPATLHTMEQGMQRWLTERMTSAVSEDQLRIQLPLVADLLGMDDGRADIDSVHRFASTSAGWLLAAFHPKMRDLTWTLPRVDTETQEFHLLSLVSFLPSDLLPEAVSSIAFDRWAEAAKQYLSIEDDAGVRVTIQEQANEFSAEEMPERKERAARVFN